MYIKAKRDNDVLSKAEQAINEIPMTDEQRDVLNKLCENYRLSTYENYDDRHEYYRTIVEDMVNDFGFQDEELAEKMANNHPTLQQSFMRFCIKFIKKMSEKTYCDARNSASVELAKKMMNAAEEEHYLPFV